MAGAMTKGSPDYLDFAIGLQLLGCGIDCRRVFQSELKMMQSIVLRAGNRITMIQCMSTVERENRDAIGRDYARGFPKSKDLEANSSPAATSTARTTAWSNEMGPGALCGAAAQEAIGTGTLTPGVNSIVCPPGFLKCKAGPCRHIGDFSTRVDFIPRSVKRRSATERSSALLSTYEM